MQMVQVQQAITLSLLVWLLPLVAEVADQGMLQVAALPRLAQRVVQVVVVQRSAVLAVRARAARVATVVPHQQEVATLEVVAAVAQVLLELPARRRLAVMVALAAHRR
jgi:hypothetical protein